MTLPSAVAGTSWEAGVWTVNWGIYTRPFHVTRLLSMGTGDRERAGSFLQEWFKKGRKETCPSYKCKFRVDTDDFGHIVLAEAFVEPNQGHMKRAKLSPCKGRGTKAFLSPAQTFLFSLSR